MFMFGKKEEEKNVDIHLCGTMQNWKFSIFKGMMSLSVLKDRFMVEVKNKLKIWAQLFKINDVVS